MAHLTIENFGPIKKFDGDIDDFSLIIGKQATGKSTIAQLVYFFKMFPEYLASSLWDRDYRRVAFNDFSDVICRKFVDCFQPTFHGEEFRITYVFSSATSQKDILQCSISAHQHSVLKIRIVCSETLDIEIRKLIHKSDFEETEKNLKYYTGVVQAKEGRDQYDDYLQATKEIFSSQQTPIYIPAGRVLFSLLSGQQRGLLFSGRQFLLRDYEELLIKMRPTFNETLEDVERNARQINGTGDVSEQAVLARELITDILGGKFELVKNDERIYHDEKAFTLLQYASSGQQETVWIALLAYLLVLEAKPVFVVFEEPESHLYPLAQNSLLRLLVLAFLANKDNSVMVTTHSPYILSAANNLIFAHNVASSQTDALGTENIHKIIDKHLWLPFSRVNAYKSGEEFENILDTEQKMIKTELIDDVSEQLNTEYDQLLDNLV